MDPADEAVRMARRSDMLHRHGAVITRGGQVIARGFNKVVNHYHHLWSQHAEIDALCDLKRRFPVESRNKRWMRDCRLYVVRIGPDSMGNPLKNSLPCHNCSQAILDACIPVVFYSGVPNISNDASSVQSSSSASSSHTHHDACTGFAN